MRLHRQILSTFAILGVFSISACGGGGSTSPPATLSGKTLVWTAPSNFEDGSSLDPGSDLKYFEIYLKQDLPFGENDNPIATAPPTATTFDLAGLAPSLSKGVTYYVCVRAVPVDADGVKSDFSDMGSFSFPKSSAPSSSERTIQSLSPPTSGTGSGSSGFQRSWRMVLRFFRIPS